MSNPQRKVLMAATAAVENGATIQTNVTPFLIGQTVIARIEPTAFTGTIKLQTSEDGTTWSDHSTHAFAGTSDAAKTTVVKLAQYIRGITTVFTAGVCDVALEA
jgi:hypothetical protein